MHWFWRATIAAVVGTLFSVISIGLSLALISAAYRWLLFPVVIAFMFTSCLIAGVLAGIWCPKSDNETRCRKCGYILRGIPEPRCSECGERI
jgi:hypothetical protein